jgi:ABC-type uncharacterized transport system substrate-binding protein
MKRREFIAGFGGVAAWSVVATAQQRNEIKRVGVLYAGKNVPDLQDWLSVFETQLKLVGWIVGRNLVLDYRYGENDPARLTQCATELISSSPNLILAASTPSLVALKKQTDAVPIVFTLVSDPVAQGFVAEFARPGGNITGLANFEPNIGSKWLELLKEIAPQTTRVAVMFNPSMSPYNGLFLRSIETAAPSFSISVSTALLNNANEIEPMFVRLATERGTSLIVLADAFTYAYSEQIVALAAEQRLPTTSATRRFALDGGLASYSVDVGEQFREAAVYVDRILKGEKPADLPVQQPTKFELIINLKTAKTLGLNVPQRLLYTADEVIE